MFIVVEKSEVSRQDKSLQKNPNELIPRVKRAKYITLYKKKKKKNSVNFSRIDSRSCSVASSPPSPYRSPSRQS